jgi:RND family efflux transporter MFP subunit
MFNKKLSTILKEALLMKKYIIFSILIIVALIVIITLTISNKDKVPPPNVKQTYGNTPVSVIKVKKMQLTNVISLVGVVNASKDVNVISEAQGLVVEVKVKVGDFVKAGDILFKIDDLIMRSYLASAEINYLKGKRDFERSESLYQENSISAAQLDLARLQMKAAESQLTLAKKQLSDTQIKAPISGTINKRMVEQGTMVNIGTPVANIVDISTLKVIINVSEKDAFQIKTNDKTEITTDVYPGVIFGGRVDNIASKADEAHTYQVEVRLPNESKNPLKAGMFARVNFALINNTESLVIPRESLVGSIKDASVYAIQDQVARLRKVVVGKSEGNFLEILSGLNENEVVVTNGQNNLSDNSIVTIIK